MNMKNNLKNFEVLILDEADRLLELGFRENLKTIFKSSAAELEYFVATKWDFTAKSYL